jgi:hypothetical protein
VCMCGVVWGENATRPPMPPPPYDSSSSRPIYLYISYVICINIHGCTGVVVRGAVVVAGRGGIIGRRRLGRAGRHRKAAAASRSSRRRASESGNWCVGTVLCFEGGGDWVVMLFMVLQ